MARLLSDETETPFGVLIHEDKRVENEETFSVMLSLPPSDGSNVRLAARSVATIFIKDNDSEPFVLILSMENISLIPTHRMCLSVGFEYA